MSGDGARLPAGPEDGRDVARSGRPDIGAFLTLRRALVATAIALFVALAVLIGYFARSSAAPGSLVTRGGAVATGIQPVLAIEGPGRGAYPRFSGPMGVAFGPDGRIYVVDTGHDRVCVFEGNGSFLFEFGTFGVAKPLPGGKYSWKPGRLNQPVGIDVADDGSVYVADFRNDQIQVFDADGEYARVFPNPRKRVGRGASGQDGTGIAVTDVAVSGGKVYATDTYQVMVFDLSGKLLLQFGKPGTGRSDLDHPNGIDVDSSGIMYVSDSNHARVVAFRPDGTRLWSVGGTVPQMGKASSTPLALPRGITLTSAGDLLVADALAFEIVEISHAGTIGARFGERGVGPAQFNFPNGIDSSGEKVAVADKGNDRVLVVDLAP